MPSRATIFNYQRVTSVPLVRHGLGRLSFKKPAGNGLILIRLAATYLHSAVTTLFDSHSAVNVDWPELQSPSIPMANQFRRSKGRRRAGFPRLQRVPA